MILSIIHNLGLGDHIICAPIVAKIASETRNKVMLPCWKHNRESVASFFVNYPNVIPMPIEKESELRDFEPSIRLGHYGTPRQDGEDFITWFYRQANFPLEDREKWCPLAKSALSFDNDVKAFPYKHMLLHDDKTRGYEIKEVPDSGIAHILRPTILGSILKWHQIIQAANEIHCIDSSFLHLADALPTTGKLFFHRYARAGEHNKNLALRKKWEVIE